MAKTGYLVIVYQDINPSSPTYNQTREERTQDETTCPYRADARWIEDTKYCELSNGMYTGYEITVYRDVEPLSSTYNQTREEKVLNTTDCETDETTAEWQNIGDPYCRQTVYMPGGLMDNDGYIVQQQQDVNEYSETYGEIRENATLDTENCPLPNTEPVWQIISESCHVVTHDGQLVYDGTKDVVRVNTNRYSPTWNNNIPETANIEDEENCPPFIETQYRWVAIDGQYECVGYDKHSVEKKQQSKDGGTTWTDVSPTETRTGSVIESNSADCGYITPQYRWVVTGTYVCVGYDKHEQEKEQVSYDGGSTWEDTENTRTGSLIEANSEYCGYSPTVEYRWVVISGQYECVGYDKYSVEKKQQSIDGGEWTDVSPIETRTGSVIERNSEDCGYVEPQYRWVTIEGSFVCSGYNKYAIEKQQVSYDGGTTWTDTEEPTRTGSLIESDSSDCGYVPPTPEPGDYSKQYLTFEAVDGGTVTITATSTNVAKTIQYSLDNGSSWTGLTTSTTEQSLGGTLSTGDKVLVKGTNSSYYNNSFGGTAKVNVYGNVMSLIYGDDFIDKNTLSGSSRLSDLFYNNTNLLSAENLVLPATTLVKSCYSNMFSGCTDLTKVPELPATTLAQSCYLYMFQGCTSLTTAPALPATTLAGSCYLYMFDGCTNLTTAPALPATTLASACYSFMFRGCTSLAAAPELPATTLADGCYNAMFSNCTSLTSAPTLPATTLTSSCYYQMFSGCTGLTTAPALPATTLIERCYSSMFSGCTSLTTAPALPATTLATRCYQYMFSGCTSLTTAPALPAKTLVSYCYSYMFRNCTSLNYIKAMFTTYPSGVSPNYYTQNWVSGVASTGTFIKNSAATWSGTGVHSVPSGWTVQTASE